MNVFDAWGDLGKEAIKKAFHERQSDPNLPLLVQEAASRGYKPAPLDVLIVGNGVGIFTWKGHHWIEIGGEWDEEI